MPITFATFYLEGLPNHYNWVIFRDSLFENDHNQSGGIENTELEKKGAEKGKVDHDKNKLRKRKKRCIIFFPGDITDFFSPPEREKIANIFHVEKHAQACETHCIEYHYSIEGLFWIISSKFPNDFIIFVRAAQIKNRFARYLNFFPCDEFGDPIEIKPEKNSSLRKSSENSLHLSSPVCNSDTKFPNLGHERSAAIIAADDDDYNAIKHLSLLLANLIKIVEENHGPKTEKLISSNPIVLIGFSKGCLILTSILKQFDTDLIENHEKEKLRGVSVKRNQINETLRNLNRDNQKLINLDMENQKIPRISIYQFFSNIEIIHYIDPGTNTQNILFDISKKKLQEISLFFHSKKKVEAFEKNLHNDQIEEKKNSDLIWIHCTPRQFYDVRRPFIQKEILQFCSILSGFSLKPNLIHYYANDIDNPSLNMHFEILHDFITQLGYRGENGSEVCLQRNYQKKNRNFEAKSFFLSDDRLPVPVISKDENHVYSTMPIYMHFFDEWEKSSRP